MPNKKDMQLQTEHPCSGCNWFLPNLYKKFMNRMVPLEKCGIDAFNKGPVPMTDKLKEISWDPQKKGCGQFEPFVERREPDSSVH